MRFYTVFLIILIEIPLNVQRKLINSVNENVYENIFIVRFYTVFLIILIEIPYKCTKKTYKFRL